MAKLKTQHVMPGWFRIASGISVIDWSNLASWNGAELEAATDQAAFNLHWPTIDPKFGRWLCWIAFGVGAESIVKGAFGLKNYHVANFGAAQPWETSKMDENVDFVSKAIHLLATEIRNRDAHEYVPGVRDKDFPNAASQFVPALNHVLNCLGKETVRLEVARHYANKSLRSQT